MTPEGHRARTRLRGDGDGLAQSQARGLRERIADPRPAVPTAALALVERQHEARRRRGAQPPGERHVGGQHAGPATDICSSVRKASIQNQPPADCLIDSVSGVPPCCQTLWVLALIRIVAVSIVLAWGADGAHNTRHAVAARGLGLGQLRCGVEVMGHTQARAAMRRSDRRADEL